MTINQLRQYRKLKSRKNMLCASRDDVIMRSRTGDGTGGSYGGVSNPVAVSAEKRDKLTEKIDGIQRQLDEIESYIDSCDEYVGTMLKLHYINGKSWANIALRAGGNNTENGVRMICHRFVRKNP